MFDIIIGFLYFPVPSKIWWKSKIFNWSNQNKNENGLENLYHEDLRIGSYLVTVYFSVSQGSATRILGISKHLKAGFGVKNKRLFLSKALKIRQGLCSKQQRLTKWYILVYWLIRIQWYAAILGEWYRIELWKIMEVI